MNTDLRKKAKNNFEIGFLKLLTNVAFGKTMENVRKQILSQLFTTEERRNYSVSEPNYHTANFFTETFLAIEIKKKQRHL